MNDKEYGSEKKLKEIDRRPFLGMVLAIIAGLINGALYLVSARPYNQSESVDQFLFISNLLGFLSIISIVLIVIGFVFAFTSDKESPYRKPSIIVNVIVAITIFVLPFVGMLAIFILWGISEAGL